MTEIATIDVADVQRLMKQRDDARAERDRARDLAARLAGIVHRDHQLLWLVIGEHSSSEAEQDVGRLIAAHLREVSMIPSPIVGTPEWCRRELAALMDGPRAGL